MQKVLHFALIIVFFSFLIACGGEEATTETTEETTTEQTEESPIAEETTEEVASEKAGLTAAFFIQNVLKEDGTPMTFENASGDAYFFRADKTAGYAGPNGEQDMMEGIWNVQDGKLIIDMEGAPTEYYEVKFKDGNLWLTGEEYKQAAY